LFGELDSFDFIVTQQINAILNVAGPMMGFAPALTP